MTHDRRPMLIVGAGNPLRHDDGVGVVIARRLRDRLPEGLAVIEKSGDLASLLDDWEEAGAVIVIDATSSGASPGTVRRYEAHDAPLPALFSRASTHAFGVGEAIELARALGRLPRRVVVFGVEGRDFTPGEGLSPEVEAAVDGLVARVTEEAGARA